MILFILKYINKTYDLYLKVNKYKLFVCVRPRGLYKYKSRPLKNTLVDSL